MWSQKLVIAASYSAPDTTPSGKDKTVHIRGKRTLTTTIVGLALIADNRLSEGYSQCRALVVASWLKVFDVDDA
jgi:hypothetical protein